MLGVTITLHVRKENVASFPLHRTNTQTHTLHNILQMCIKIDFY